MDTTVLAAVIVRVLHNRNDRFVSAGDPDYCANTKLVATVTVPPGKEPRAWAFRMTNHIDSDWTENPSVVAEPGHHRSTSVGDVLEVIEAGKAPIRYVLEPCGYRQM